MKKCLTICTENGKMIYEKIKTGGSCMYKSAKELIKGEVTPELELQIYYSVKNGIEVYK